MCLDFYHLLIHRVLNNIAPILHDTVNTSHHDSSKSWISENTSKIDERQRCQQTQQQTHDAARTTNLKQKLKKA